MNLFDTESAYGAVSRILHWLIALLIFALTGLGFWMVDLSYYDRWYYDALALHKALGMLALGLGVVKVLWMLAGRRVRHLPSRSAFARRAASAVHHLLYLAMIAIPVTGYLVSTSAGDGIAMFGDFEVPALVPVSETARDLAITLHYWLAYGVGMLALGHAGAAIWHALVDRDGTLRRMLW